MWADPATGSPAFRNREGAERHAWEVASQNTSDKAIDVFLAVKRWMDIADKEAVCPYGWHAADRAKFGLEFALKALGRWDSAMRRSSIGVG